MHGLEHVARSAQNDHAITWWACSWCRRSIGSDYRRVKFLGFHGEVCYTSLLVGRSAHVLHKDLGLKMAHDLTGTFLEQVHPGLGIRNPLSWACVC